MITIKNYQKWSSYVLTRVPEYSMLLGIFRGSTGTTLTYFKAWSCCLLTTTISWWKGFFCTLSLITRGKLFINMKFHNMGIDDNLIQVEGRSKKEQDGQTSKGKN